MTTRRLSQSLSPLPLIPGVFLNRSSLTLTFLHLWVARRRLIYPIFMRTMGLCCVLLSLNVPWRRDFHPSQIVEVELD